MQVATSIHCSVHEKVEWGTLDTRSGELTSECGRSSTVLSDAEMADILLD